MSRFDLEQELAALRDPSAPRVLTSYVSAGPSMLGVATKLAGSTDGFWERHDMGDELLVVLRGRMTMTIRAASGDESAETIEVGPGQIVFLPRGAPHSAHIIEDIDVLFITPTEGNAVWNEAL
jgi:mannose-6-phosphate isomerase-like protein (cupin superfamily)